jgi:hypothetical protein
LPAKGGAAEGSPKSGLPSAWLHPGRDRYGEWKGNRSRSEKSTLARLPVEPIEPVSIPAKTT